jgi:hypothetical protein
VRLRPNRGFLGRLAHRRDPFRNWLTNGPGQFMGVHVMRQVNAGSPGSDGASPYQSCSLSIFKGGRRKNEHDWDPTLKARSRDSPEPGNAAGSVPR